jgi:L-ascorbate metabolism protein UlaG (beta-lactamase superfamily)
LFVGTERTVRALKEKGLPDDRIRGARYGQPIRVGEVTITPTPARHEESKGHTQRGDCCGFIINAVGTTFWHPNDTDLLEEHLEVTGLDVLLLPIAPHVLGTEGAVKLAESSAATHIIPCHYGTYDSDVYWCTGDPTAVRRGISDSARRYHQLAVGEKLVLPARR